MDLGLLLLDFNDDDDDDDLALSDVFGAILVAVLLTVCNRRVEWIVERNIMGRRAFMVVTNYLESRGGRRYRVDK